MKLLQRPVGGVDRVDHRMRRRSVQYDVAPCDGAGPVEALQEVRRPSDGLVALLVQRLAQADPVAVPVPWIGGEDVVQLQDGALVLESEALCEDRQPHADVGFDLIGGLPQEADSGPQGVGKVGLGGWSGDQVDGSSGASCHGPGGGGDGGCGAVGQADEADGEVAQGGHDLGSVAGAQLVAVIKSSHYSVY